MTLENTNLFYPNLILSVLTDDLRRKPWKGLHDPVAGHCYVASEAEYYLEAKDLGFVPYQMKWEGSSHWFLMNDEGVALDLTATQFSDLPDYLSAKRRAFLTKTPSKRALIVIDRVRGLL